MRLHKSPCTRECPDRKPGCDCEKRQAWKADVEARKKWLKDMNAADEVAFSGRLKTRKQHNV